MLMNKRVYLLSQSYKSLTSFLGTLVSWMGRRFLDAEFDGSNPQLYQFVESLSKTLYALLQSTQLINRY